MLGIALIVMIAQAIFVKTKFTKLGDQFEVFKQDTREELAGHYEIVTKELREIYSALRGRIDLDSFLRTLDGKLDAQKERLRVLTNQLPQFNNEAVRFYLDTQFPGIIPTKANPMDSGWDMYCNLELLNQMVKDKIYELPRGVTIATGQEGLFITIGPGVKLKIPTGVRYILPYAVEASVRPKSGISLKTELELTNAPGTIDNGYTGDASLIVKNCGRTNLVIKDKHAIAQVVFQYVLPIRVSIQPINSDSFELACIVKDREANGFGSSNTNGSDAKMGELDDRIHIPYDPRFDVCEMISVMGEELIKEILAANPKSIIVYNNFSISSALLLQHLTSPVERRGVLDGTLVYKKDHQLNCVDGVISRVVKTVVDNTPYPNTHANLQVGVDSDRNVQHVNDHKTVSITDVDRCENQNKDWKVNENDLQASKPQPLSNKENR